MKRTADTSRAALAAIAPDLPTRAADVLDALQRCSNHHRSDPTAYELLRWMQIERPTLDLNAVRPRLTELKDAGRVRTGDKRRCAVTEQRVYTWRVASPAPQPKPWIEAMNRIPAIQPELF
jgi:hypothetical protein